MQTRGTAAHSGSVSCSTCLIIFVVIVVLEPLIQTRTAEPWRGFAHTRRTKTDKTWASIGHEDGWLLKATSTAVYYLWILDEAPRARTRRRPIPLR